MEPRYSMKLIILNTLLIIAPNNAEIIMGEDVNFQDWEERPRVI